MRIHNVIVVVTNINESGYHKKKKKEKNK